MRQNDATERGKHTAGQWLLDGTVSAGAVVRQGKSDLTALLALCRRLDGSGSGDENPAAQLLFDQLWLLRREGDEAVAKLRGLGRLPAVRLHGRCARVQLLGECAAQEAGAWTTNTLLDWLRGVQSAAPLWESELCALLPCLILGVVRQVREIAAHLEEDGRAEELQACFAALGLFTGKDFSDFLEKLSQIHAVFARDETYRLTSHQGRQRYRARLAKLARRAGADEGAFAQALLEQAQGEGRHVGFLLFPPAGKGRWYPCLLGLLTLAWSAFFGWLGGAWWLAAAALLPVSELVKKSADFAALRLVKPRPVFRLALEDGVPPEGKTLCVICAVLTGDDAAETLSARLEQYYLANRSAGAQVNYGLLADLPDSRFPQGVGGEARLQGAKRQIDRLNGLYGGRFYLFTREQTYVQRDNCYRGWERKRGALLELLTLLRGKSTTLEVRAGDRAELQNTAYLLTLDSDTRLGPDAVRRLAGAMLHPLNRPVVDEKRNVVIRGYGLLQPRLTTDLEDANATPFAALFCGGGGSDPYAAGAANLYHDLFDRASYCGKGILDVAAAERCLTGRFPENRILSHDLLEGCVLRAGFCGEVELADGFPPTVEGYFRRQHRWVRGGGWQAARWLAGRVPNQAGERVSNPLSPIDRWKLLDNLRRSLLPAAVTALLLLSALKPTAPGRFCGGLALVALGFDVLLAALGWALRGFRGCRQRTFRRGYGPVTGAAIRGLVQLLWLPSEGWVGLSAVCTALWRTTVTHRGLLDWTVSSQAKGGKRFWLPGMITGAALLWLAPGLGGKLLGLGWLAAPVLLGGLSKMKKTQSPFTAEEKDYLTEQAREIWRYFDAWLRPEDHYLPLDNVQELPDLGPARRTSPTNIGLALLACLAAVDLGVTEKKRAVEKIERQLDTLEKLDKWRGHLYNWYDTATAQPLYPRYVSTVDSGNLCGALIALKQGLLELGEPVLARRAAALADNMQFEHLYDADRALFCIGYDAEQGAFTENWYDLLASEARQTSYLAVARGDVPPRHWGRLSRSMTCLKGRFGLASWSGTMFEYFMPHLLLPAEKGSLLWESLALCARAQKEWGEKNGLPWGVSESAYARLNGEQNYQYKAHGVPPLGLQRGLERMRVVAPYATFLALEFLPHSAIQNLHRLADLGAEGECGFYEAVDFTEEQPVVVRNWMVHHLGMSLLAIDNALNDSVMRRRFLAEPAMAAYRGLLQERMPLGLTPPKPLHITEKRSKMKQNKGFLRTGQGFDPAAPACHLLAVESLTLPLTAGGGGVLRREGLLLAEPLKACFRDGKERLRLFPTGPAGEDLRWRFSAGTAELSVQRGGVSIHRRLTLSAGGLLDEWTVEARREGLLEVRVTPVLDDADAYEAHRAFSRLSLELESVAGGAILTRRPREGKQTPALAVLWEGNCTLEDAENCVLRLTLPLQPGKTALRLALATGEGNRALHAAQGLLAGAKTGGEDLFCARSARYGLTGAAQRQLDELTSRLLYPRDRSGVPRGQSALWPYGVSGDLPLWAVLTVGQEEKQLDRCIRQWAILRDCGLPFDLALLAPEEGDTARKLTELCKKLRLTEYLGEKGGIHLIPANPAAVEDVTGMAALIGPVGEPENKFQCTPPPAVPLRPAGEPIWRWEGNVFMLETNGGLLPRRWSHILTNGSFGWTADDCGTGHLWATNAHENKLTPWRNDPAAHKGPERLSVVDGGEETSLFAAADGISAVIRYGPGFAAWEKRWGNKKISLTAFVPPTGAARFFLVESSGFGPGAALRWRVELQMSPHVRGRNYVVVTPHEGELWAESPANTDFPGEILRFSASGPLALAGRENNYTFTAQVPLERELVLTAGLETPLPVAPAEVRLLLEETKRHWEEQAGCFTLRSPDPALNHYLSFWGRYQVIACRLLARSALYQCGGAYGFRDQLQDVCGLLPNSKELAREQILRCCRHQYREGDAQHWWHPLAKGERGCAPVSATICCGCPTACAGGCPSPEIGHFWTKKLPGWSPGLCKGAKNSGMRRPQSPTRQTPFWSMGYGPLNIVWAGAWANTASA